MAGTGFERTQTILLRSLERHSLHPVCARTSVIAVIEFSIESEILRGLQYGSF